MKTLVEMLKDDLSANIPNLTEADLNKIADSLFSDDTNIRLDAVNELKGVFESYKLKPVKRMAQLKDKDGYIVAFISEFTGDDTADTFSIMNKNMDDVNSIRIVCHGTGYSVRKGYSPWRIARLEYRPSKDVVYEVPENLVDIIDKIFNTAQNFN